MHNQMDMISIGKSQPIKGKIDIVWKSKRGWTCGTREVIADMYGLEGNDKDTQMRTDPLTANPR